jgi:hypothetical protein
MSNLKRAMAIAAGMAMISSGVALADPLAAGKPAGVKQAQVESVPVMAWIALAGIAAAGIAAAASSGNSQSTFTTVPASTTA